MGWLKDKSLLPMWLVLIGASIVGADHASACTCAFLSAASTIERADVAFEGEVIDVGWECVLDGFVPRKDRRPFFSCERRAQLRVLTPLKGAPDNIVAVYHNVWCGYSFKKGERLKVVAWYKRDRRLSTGGCAMWDANR